MRPGCIWDRPRNREKKHCVKLPPHVNYPPCSGVFRGNTRPTRTMNLGDRARRTTLKVGNATVETVEHCMSAFAGLRIDNALVEINGQELPCGDGSASPFVDPILEAGLVEQDAPRRVFRVSEPIVVEEGDAMLAAF